MQNQDEEIKFGKTFQEAKLGKNVVNNILSLLELDPSKKVLDAGCGSGYWGRMVADKFKVSVLGVDINPFLLAKAKTMASKTQRFKEANLLSLKLNERFDLIICGGILHHFPTRSNLKEVLRNLKNHLEDNGEMVIIEPNGSNPIIKMSNFLARFLRRRDAKISSSNETWHSARTISRILKELGFSGISSRSFFYNNTKDITKEKFKDLIVLTMVKVRAFLYEAFRFLFPKWYRSGTVLVIKCQAQKPRLETTLSSV
jgi:2-polyprenyl-3-methyl-5-hydroxy-6-metoxy-1,4-benzoquinol methylase